ncbi:MAG TPA: hypothetical protein VIL25_08550 [Vicinamibacterales bacterium]
MTITKSRTPLRERSWAPALTLILLSPLVGEVLNGATRLSYIAVFVPQVMVWGCGTLLIRETVHRWGGSWPSTIALAAALSIFIEFLVLQTSVAPIPWLTMASIPVYDRIWGINWLWFAYMLGYEIVWVVLVPILLTMLVFPERRSEPWLRARGLGLVALVFALGSAGLWVLWTRLAVPNAFGQPVYDPPLWTLAAALTGCALAVAIGWALRTSPRAQAPTGGTPMAPLPLGLAIAGLALPWWGLIVLVFVPRPLPLVPVLGLATMWAGAATWLIARWSRHPGWDDRHRFAIACSALLVTMAAGFLGSQFWPLIDVIAKLAMNVVATIWVARLGRTVWRRTAAQVASAAVMNAALRP